VPTDADSDANLVVNPSIQAQVYALLDAQIGQTARTIYLKTTDLVPNQVHHALYRLRKQGLAASERRGHGLDLLWRRYPGAIPPTSN
jgi:hypothetical protein